MSYIIEIAQYELEQLNFWFKMNKDQQGSDEWNEQYRERY